jgi:hypothetical protein
LAHPTGDRTPLALLHGDREPGFSVTISSVFRQITRLSEGVRKSFA